MAVVALAFTMFAVLETADKNAAVNVYEFDSDYVNPDSVTASMTGNGFYISEDTTVKMKGQNPSTSYYYFFVQNGVSLTLDFKNTWGANNAEINIVTVTGDQQANLYMEIEGKFDIYSTAVTFIPVSGMSVYYQGAIVKYDVDYDREANAFDRTVEPEIERNAYFSADRQFQTIAVGYCVEVAPGQTVEGVTPGIENLVWGICTINADSVTYYSLGADAGNFTLDNNSIVFVLDGKINAKNGSSSVKVDKSKENDWDESLTVIWSNGSNLGLGFGDTSEDQMAKGTITASGNIAFDGFAFSGGTVTLANKTTIETASDIYVGGTLVLKNTAVELQGNLSVYGTGTVVASNTKLWNDEPTTGIDVNLEAFTGLVDTSAISKTARMEKDISSSKIEVNQTFELFGNTTISKLLTVEGILIIDEGVTLTIDKGATIEMAASENTGNLNYAQIINRGTIIVKSETFGEGLFIDSGKMVNHGTISLASKSSLAGDMTQPTLYSGGLGIKNFGNITVSKSDYVYLERFDNNAGGKLNVNGKFLGASVINNKGSILFNGAEITEDNASVTIRTKSTDAQFYISSVKIGEGAGNGILVDDTRFKHYDGDNVIHTGNSGVYIGLTADDVTTSTIRGLSIGETVDEDDNPQMTISGGMTVSSSKKQVDISLLAMGVDGYYYTPDGGNFLVDGTFTVPAYARLGFFNYDNADIYSAAAEFPIKVTVTGDMTINKDAFELTDDGTLAETNLYVTGSIVSKDGNKIFHAHFVAAMVENSDGDVYFMTLEDALDYAVRNDLNTIDVGYVNTGDGKGDYVTVTESMTVPAEMSIQTVAAYDVDSVMAPAKI